MVRDNCCGHFALKLWHASFALTQMAAAAALE